MSNLYLWLDILTLAGPFILSFDKKVAFWRFWKRLFPGVLVMMAIFIPWDIAFTEHGVWGFNPEYLSGIWIAGLPLEEWLFFIVVPYACVFIYACLNAYFPKWGHSQYGINMARALGPLLILIGVMHYNQLYTLTAFGGCGALLIVLGYAFKPDWLGRFFNAYFVALVPFFVVNGILTGTGIDRQVVWYNDAHNLGVRLGTIPLDDTVYNMLMLLIVVTTLESLNRRSKPLSSPNNL